MKAGDRIVIEIADIIEIDRALYKERLYAIKGLEDLLVKEKVMDKISVPPPPATTNTIRKVGYTTGVTAMSKAIKKIVMSAKKGGFTAGELREIFGVADFDAILCDYKPLEIIEKVNAYEGQKKAEEEIKVGDEIEYKLFEDMVKAVVLQVVDIGEIGYKVLCENGCGQVIYKTGQPITKTGKHYDIEEILKAMRGR